MKYSKPLFKMRNLLLFRSFLRFYSEEAAKPLRNTKFTSSSIIKLQRFVDYRVFTATGGKGGDGCIAFLRLSKNPNAGPSGGDGGNGGHVILQAKLETKSLEEVPRTPRAGNGVSGRGKHMHGANGSDYVIHVPLGTIIKENDRVVCELNDHDAKFIAARGGAGGHGNHFFLTNENRHPDLAELGANGEIRKYALELKIMAHIGLVGFPNAGKSTLLRAISRARPKIASYPFTTLNPHIGIVHYDDYVQLAVADLPGIIEGAHQNRGLGISFLKHIERCAGILYVIDVSSNNALQELAQLQYELEQYQTGLSSRPHAVVANKCDLDVDGMKLKELKEALNKPVFPISAKFGTNMLDLLKYIRKLYDESDNKMVW